MLCIQKRSVLFRSDMLDRKTPLEEKEDEIKWNRLANDNGTILLHIDIQTVEFQELMNRP